MTSVFHKILRAVAGAMEIPDVVFLVLALGFAVFSVGWLICEYFTEHRHMREDLPRLFDRFYRADKSRAYDGGTGIGLAIARAIVQALGGSINAETSDGKSIVFRAVI